MTQLGQQIQSRLNGIRASFVQSMTDHSQIATAILEKRRGGVIPEAERESLRFISHKIHGTAATLGFANLGAAAAQLEIDLKGFSDGDVDALALEQALEAFASEADGVCPRGSRPS